MQQHSTIQTTSQRQDDISAHASILDSDDANHRNTQWEDVLKAWSLVHKFCYSLSLSKTSKLEPGMFGPWPSECTNQQMPNAFTTILCARAGFLVCRYPYQALSLVRVVLVSVVLGPQSRSCLRKAQTRVMCTGINVRFCGLVTKVQRALTFSFVAIKNEISQ